MENNVDKLKEKKRTINIALLCISIIIGVLLIDLLILKLTGYPIFAIKDKESTDTERIYNSIFYKAWKCDVKKKPNDVIIKVFNRNFSCDIKDLKDNEYIISDETETCAQALEEISRDNKFIYYLPCIKSSTVFLKYGDGTKISVKEALTKKKVTIKELIEKGLNVYKEVINK